VPSGPNGTVRWVVLPGGGFMPPLDFHIVNVALSPIHQSPGADPAELAWPRVHVAWTNHHHVAKMTSARRLRSFNGRTTAVR
jgi:hypothetical protein